MAQFTQLNLQAKAETKKLDADQRKRSKSNAVIITVGSLLLASSLGILLATNGCSKGTSKPAVVDSGNQNPSSTQATGPAVPVSLPSTTATASQPAPKKVVKRRPSVVNYTDAGNGLSFRYPRKYTLKTGDKLDAESTVPMNFVQPGGIILAALEMPKKAYPGTDFSSGLFNVSVNKSLTAEECTQFAFPKAEHPENELGAPSKVKVGETEFNLVEDFGPMKAADAKYYHVYENGACYEFATALETSGDQVDDQTKPVDRDQVFARLNKILASVKVKPMPEPEVVTGKAEQPAEAPAAK